MDLAEQIDWKEPSIYLETCTESQSWEGPAPIFIPEHTRRPVFFGHAIERLSQRFSECSWLEAGHDSSVMQLLRGALGVKQDTGYLILSPQLNTPNAAGALSDVTVNLWKTGYRAQYWLFHRSQKQQYQSLTLPPYQFEKSWHWVHWAD